MHLAMVTLLAVVGIVAAVPTGYAPTTTTRSYSVSCEGKELYSVLFDYSPCPDYYFECIGDPYGVRRDCAAGTFFDKTNLVCDFAEFIVNCGGEPRPPVESTTTTEAGPTEPPLLVCKEPGDFPDPRNYCSRYFVRCDANLVAHTTLCPGEETYFDVVLGICDFFANVEKCSGTPRPPTTTTEASEPSKRISCAGKELHTLFSVYEACPDHYFECTGGDLAVERSCAPGTFWDKVNLVCDVPEHVVNCGGEPRPPTEATTTTEAGPTEPPLLVCKEPGDFPDPRQYCSRFFVRCDANLVAHTTQCPGDNTYFDVVLGICDYFANVEKCSGTPRPPTTTTEAAPTRTYGHH